MRSDDPEFGKMMGILYMVFNFLCGFVALVFFIIYWIKIAGYKNELMSHGRGGAEDDYDDGPRRGHRRRDEDDEYDDEDDRPRRRRDDDE